MTTLELLNSLTEVMSISESVPKFAAFTLAYGAQEREGMSASLLISRVISRQSEIEGASTSEAYDSGTPNAMNQLITIMCQEIIREIRMRGRVEVAAPSGSIQVTVKGGNAGGPVVSTGSNSFPGKSYGILI